VTEVDDKRAAAIRRLRAKHDFWNHLVVYVAVNLLLIVIWYFSGHGYFWPIWSIAGWGIGVVMNAWTVFFQRPVTEAEIQREMERGG